METPVTSMTFGGLAVETGFGCGRNGRRRREHMRRYVDNGRKARLSAIRDAFCNQCRNVRMVLDAMADDEKTKNES